MGKKFNGGSLQVKNGIYQAVFSKNGKTIWRSTGIKAVKGNKRKAQARLEEIRQELQNDEPQSNILFTDYCNQWLESKKDTVREVTYIGYSQKLNSVIIPYFAKKKFALSEIKVADIDRFLKEQSKNYATSSLNGLKAIISNIFKEAVRTGLLQNNPCQYTVIPKSKVISTEDNKVYTAEEIKHILTLCEGKPIHDMILITFKYGLRREEMFGLRWKDVDFTNKIIHIRNTVTITGTKKIESETTKTSKSKRDYPIDAEMLEVLQKLKKAQAINKGLKGMDYKNGDKVFLKQDGSEYCVDYARQAFKKLLKKNGLPDTSWHYLRHGCISYMHSENISDKDIADWVGHEDIRTTMNIYTTIDFERKKSILDSTIKLCA